MKGAPGGGRVVTGESYIGEICSKRPECGFIKSPLVNANHGCDTFAPAALLAKWQVGDVICFDLMLNAKGQPQATKIRDVLDFEPRLGTGKKLSDTYPTGRAFNGVLSSITETHAFIRCEPVLQYYGLDVFCEAAVLQGVPVGTMVNFELVINQKEQPQAVNVMVVSQETTGTQGVAGSVGRSGGGKYTPDGMLDTGEAYVGILQLQGDTAAVACDQTMTVFGVDVSCPAPDLNVFTVGEPVVFDLVLDGEAQPMARNLRKVLNMEARGGKGQRTKLTTPVGKSYNGVICQMSETSAFIKNQTVWDATGFDVFCSPSVLQGLQIGVEVNFELVVNQKMQPQAVSVRTIGAVEDPGMSGIFGASPGDLVSSFNQMSGLGGNPNQPATSSMQGSEQQPQQPQQLQQLPPQQQQQQQQQQQLQPQQQQQLQPQQQQQLQPQQQQQPQQPQQQPQQPQGQQENAAYVPTLTGVITGCKDATGYIQCDDVTSAYGMDSVFPVAEINGKGLNIGDMVDFDLMENQLGQPQATKIRPASEESKAKRARLS